MPIYEYRCKDCGSHFEKRQSINEDPPKICEKCNGSLEKQWSLSGFQFKGAGWYVTDYAGKAAGKKESGEKGEKSEKASGGESTDSPAAASKPASEIKPAAKADGGSKVE